MDHRTVKRPRSSTPAKGDPTLPPTKKKKKGSKKNKNKSSRSSSNDTGGARGSGGSSSHPKTKNHHPKSSLDSTATADGQKMLQMLATFSSLEQSRFEAFQRSSLDHTAVSEWLAACLHHRLHPDAALSSSSSSDVSRPTLSDLVASPQQANEIAMIVATLAKIFVQRLVTHAKQVAEREVQQQQQAAAAAAESASQSTTNGTSNRTTIPRTTPTATPGGPLAPHHIWRAWHERAQEGLNPGFFLQALPARHWKTAVVQRQEHDQLRLAALQAQEDYDKHCEEQTEQQAKGSSKKSNHAEDMDVVLQAE